MVTGYVFNVVGMLVVSVLSHYVGRGGRAGTLKLGRTPGIKTEATVASDEAWRVGHRVAAPWMFVAAGTGYVLVLVCIAYPVVAPLAGWPTGLVTAAVAACSTVVIVAIGALGMVRANRAARRRLTRLRRGGAGVVPVLDGEPRRGVAGDLQVYPAGRARRTLSSRSGRSGWTRRGRGAGRFLCRTSTPRRPSRAVRPGW